jgi:hypothetical protein
VDAKRFLPFEYDLCLLKIKGKFDKKGWHTGLVWDGLILKNDDQVLYWKLNERVI